MLLRCITLPRPMSPGRGFSGPQRRQTRCGRWGRVTGAGLVGSRLVGLFSYSTSSTLTTRLTLSQCDTDLVCHKCSVPPSKPGTEFISQTCIREEPSKVGGAAACKSTPFQPPPPKYTTLTYPRTHPARWAWKDRRFPPRRDTFPKDHNSHLIKLHVRFPTDTNTNRPGPHLEIIASPFTDPTRTNPNQPSIQHLGIVPMEGPKDENIYSWVKRQIGASSTHDFESCLERLHLNYVKNKCLDRAVKSDEKAASLKPTTTTKSLSTPPTKNINTQNELLKNILSMRCMWKVWRCDTFEITRSIDGTSEFPLPKEWDVSAIRDHLHSAAEQALSSLEKTILRDMDRYLSPIDIKDDRPVLRSAMNVASWVVLWEMILLYREAVVVTLVQQEMDQRGVDAAPFVLGSECFLTYLLIYLPSFFLPSYLPTYLPTRWKFDGCMC